MIHSATTTLTAVLLLVGCTGNDAPDPASAQDMGAMEDTSTDAMEMGERPIRITGRQASLAGVSFAVVREAELDRTVRAVATVVPDEGLTGIVNTRVGGWIESLYADETGRHVQIGEPLFELYAPDLLTAQEELLLALRLGDLQGADSMVVGARRRLARWGIADSLITAIERTGTVRETLTIISRSRVTFSTSSFSWASESKPARISTESPIFLPYGSRPGSSSRTRISWLSGSRPKLRSRPVRAVPTRVASRFCTQRLTRTLAL